jgi:hypothetical protein
VQKNPFHLYCWVLSESTSINKYLTLWFLNASWFVLYRVSNIIQNEKLVCCLWRWTNTLDIHISQILKFFDLIIFLNFLGQILGWMWTPKYCTQNNISSWNSIPKYMFHMWSLSHNPASRIMQISYKTFICFWMFSTLHNFHYEKCIPFFSLKLTNIFNPSWKNQIIIFNIKNLKWRTKTYILSVILVSNSILSKGKFLILILVFD